jgi:hypothetical protein
MFEVPESDIIAVNVDEDVILGKKQVEYIRAPSKPKTDEKEEDVLIKERVKNYA